MNIELYEILSEHEARIEITEKDNIKLITWIDFDELGRFAKVLGYNSLDEGGMECFLQDDCICIDLHEYITADCNLSDYKKVIDNWDEAKDVVIESEV